MFGNLSQNDEMHIGTFNGGYVTPPTGGSSGGGSSGGAVLVSEPGMLGLGVGGLILWRRRRAKRGEG